MLDIHISSRADRDIEFIYIYSVENFGVHQADIYYDGLFNQFELLATFPKLGRSFKHPIEKDLRRFSYGSHLIIYSCGENAVTIRRVLHMQSDLTRPI